jgi:hypothetical protein
VPAKVDSGDLFRNYQAPSGVSTSVTYVVGAYLPRYLGR